MEAKPICKFCKHRYDPSDLDAQAKHRAHCLGASLAVTLGRESPHDRSATTQTRFYRPKRRGVRRGRGSPNGE